MLALSWGIPFIQCYGANRRGVLALEVALRACGAGWLTPAPRRPNSPRLCPPGQRPGATRASAITCRIAAGRCSDDCQHRRPVPTSRRRSIPWRGAASAITCRIAVRGLTTRRRRWCGTPHRPVPASRRRGVATLAITCRIAARRCCPVPTSRRPGVPWRGQRRPLPAGSRPDHLI